MTEKLIGHGSFSKVYNGYRRKDAKRVAIKTIRKSNIQGNKQFFEAMLNEINILRMVQHPRIIQLYDVYESNKHLNLIFEYIGGGTLQEYVHNNGSPSLEITLKIFASLLDVIDYIHSMNIIHRDLKPDNIFIEYYCL